MKVEQYPAPPRPDPTPVLAPSWSLHSQQVGRVFRTAMWFEGGRDLSYRNCGGELWLCQLHPDGQWVTLKRATTDDFATLREVTSVDVCVPPSQHTARHIDVLDAMSRFGGSFVKALAEAWFRADSDNHAKLYAAFAEYYDRYEGELPKAGGA